MTLSMRCNARSEVQINLVLRSSGNQVDIGQIRAAGLEPQEAYRSACVTSTGYRETKRVLA
jgi:hypothetical protein